jgi:ribosome-associated protein
MPSSEIPSATLELLQALVRALDDKKAADIMVIDVSEVSSITNYLVLATGNSNPHLRALRIAAEGSLKERGVPLMGADVAQDSGWFVVDAFDFMVHLFTEPMRETYRLDRLWKDGVVLDCSSWLESSGE